VGGTAAALAARRYLRFVASEHIMRKGFATWFLKRYFNPIIHTKGKLGLKSSMDMLRALRKGDSVALFPEGNRSFNGLTCRIPPVTGKLAKSCGAKLVTFRIEGGYFTQPRWGTTFRRGKMHGHLVNVYTPEQLKAMSEDEVTVAIRTDLHEDAYASQEGSAAFTGKHLALGMEALLFTCPSCGKIGTLSSTDETISCACGYHAQFQPSGELLGSDGVSHTLTEWDAYQQEELKRTVENAASDTLLFSDEVSVRKIGSDHEVILTEQGTLCAYADCFSFNGKRISPAEFGMAIRSRNTLVIHLGDEETHYEITGAQSFCGLKYVYLYQLLQHEEVI